ncbi:MAG TPA: FAD-dependent oxidoreductase [Patescibacteria group bacterium]|nr:FAD-dependent oxidoreductase [Patescibacteria group bacterium]
MNVTFDHAEDIAESIKTFWFKPEQPVRYIAGQYTEMYLPHPDHDNRGERRWFTVSSSPTDPMVSITTKFARENSSTFKQTLASLAPGAQLKLADPMGDFVLPKDPTIPLVFVAGGIGVTPFHSMIKYLSDTGERRNIHMIYAVTHIMELAFQPLFKDYGLRLSVVVKEPPASYRGITGSLEAADILQLAPDDGNTLYYLSGPEPMVEAFTKGIKHQGVNKHRIVSDYFPGYLQF